MAKFNWNNKKSHTSIKNEAIERQHDQAAEWLYCRDQKSNEKKNNSAYLDSGSGIVHASNRHRESKQYRQKRERRLEQQKQRFEAEMLLYEEERRRFDMIQHCDRE
jgi:hypothetical protein